MPGLTIRRTKDESIFIGRDLDLTNPKDTFDLKIRVQKVDIKDRKADLEILTRQANYVDYGEFTLNEGDETQLEDIFIRCNELSIQAANDVLSVGDREAIALEFDELKKELLSLANIQDSGGSFIFSGYKSQTQPFEINSSGLVSIKVIEAFLTFNFLKAV